jgi:hypothetical protein
MEKFLAIIIVFINIIVHFELIDPIVILKSCLEYLVHYFDSHYQIQYYFVLQINFVLQKVLRYHAKDYIIPISTFQLLHCVNFPFRINDHQVPLKICFVKFLITYMQFYLNPQMQFKEVFSFINHEQIINFLNLLF